MRLGVVQMEISDGNVQANMEHLTMLLGSAAPADLYVLPELWSTGYAHTLWGEIADTLTPALLLQVAALAQKHNAWLAGTVIFRREDGALCNRLVVIDKGGQIAGSYDKIHLFRPFREHEFLCPGNTLPLLRIEGLRVMPAICYDLRFPGMFASAAKRGVDLFIVPAEWPSPRRSTLSVLAQARAIENQSYLAVSNRVGKATDGTTFCGSSRIVDPSGGQILLDGEMEGVIVGEINQKLLVETRSFLRVFEERISGID